MTKTPISYTNRMGKTYYLHEGTTKNGKKRYFVAKSIREGVLYEMPEGRELAESINGVVSVRRIDSAAPKIPEEDLLVVREALARLEHAPGHKVQVVKGEMVIFEPVGGVERERLRALLNFGRLARDVDLPPTRYSPVMKFVPDGSSGYSVQRQVYRGRGGWSGEVGSGDITTLARDVLPTLGTDAFFELM